MKNSLYILCLIAVFIFVGCNKNQDLGNTDNIDISEERMAPKSDLGDIIPNQYIVEIKPEVIMPARLRLDWATIETREEKVAQMEVLMAEAQQDLDAWLARYDLGEKEVVQSYTAVIVGAALNISQEKYEEISKDGDIASIEHDRMDHLPKFIVENVVPEGTGSRAQTTPCGINNAGGAGTGAGNNNWVWIIDSGIDMDHPDLNVINWGPYPRSFVGGTPDDCNGHGTHVAGTAAAINNTIGVIGVAAGAFVVPVRVFGCSGGSPTSTIISGINHVAIYDLSGDVVNMSLGGYYGSGCSTGSSYRSALNNLTTTSRTWVAIASGNNLSNANYYQPACVNGSRICTVTNMRCNKTYYNASTGGNYGRPPVDFIATGTSVYSTYRYGGYATLTGTSMATPHVAGIMLLRDAKPRSSGSVRYRSVNYPIAVR